jgi:hypothetical protein
MNDGLIGDNDVQEALKINSVKWFGELADARDLVTLE